MNNPILPKSPFSRPAPLSALLTLVRKAADFAAQKRAQAKSRATERLKTRAKSGGLNSFVLLSQYMDEVNSGPIWVKNRERRLNSLVQNRR